MHNIPRMKNLMFGLVLLGAAGTVSAGESLEQKRDAKLADGWLKKAAWFTDYDKAMAESKASGKPVFAYFTRSYAY